MTEFTVEMVQSAKPFKTRAGHDLVGYTVALKGPDEKGRIAQRNMKPDSKAPEVGDVWDIEKFEPNGSFPDKVLMVQKPRGDGGGGSRNSPEDLRQRAAQGALSNAVALAPAGTKSADILKVADTLYVWIRAKAEGK